MLLQVIGIVCKLLPFYAPSKFFPTIYVQMVCVSACASIGVRIAFLYSELCVWCWLLPFVKMPICQNIVNEIDLRCACCTFFYFIKYSLFLLCRFVPYKHSHTVAWRNRTQTDRFIWNLGVLDQVRLMWVSVRMIAWQTTMENSKANVIFATNLFFYFILFVTSNWISINYIVQTVKFNVQTKIAIFGSETIWNSIEFQMVQWMTIDENLCDSSN